MFLSANPVTVTVTGIRARDCDNHGVGGCALPGVTGAQPPVSQRITTPLGPLPRGATLPWRRVHLPQTGQPPTSGSPQRLRGLAISRAPATIRPATMKAPTPMTSSQLVTVPRGRNGIALRKAAYQEDQHPADGATESAWRPSLGEPPGAASPDHDAEVTALAFQEAYGVEPSCVAGYRVIGPEVLAVPDEVNGELCRTARVACFHGPVEDGVPECRGWCAAG